MRYSPFQLPTEDLSGRLCACFLRSFQTMHRVRLWPAIYLSSVMEDEFE